MPLRRYSSYLGRRFHLYEALLEKLAMGPVGAQYTLRLAPRIDRILIPRTNGALSSLGPNRVGLLTTTGAKTGLRRTGPVGLIPVPDGLLAIGSNYGRPTHPSWSANLIAHPDCEVQFAGRQGPHRARLLTGADRDAAWATAVDYFAGYARYAEACGPREIRVFHLKPLD